MIIIEPEEHTVPVQELIASMEGRLIVPQNANYQLKEKRPTCTRYPGYLYHMELKEPPFLPLWR